MKKISMILILFQLFLLSCNNDKEKLYEYIERYSLQNKFLDNQNKIIYNVFNKEMEPSYFGTPEAIRPWYNKVKQVTERAEAVNNKIRILLISICKADSIEPIDLKDISNSSYTIDKETLLELKNEILHLEDIYVKVIREEYNPELCNVLKSIMSTENWQNIDGLNGNKCNTIELTAVLLKLQSDIKLSLHNVLSYLQTQISSSDCQFNRIEIIVVPNKKIFTIGEEYRADIYAGNIDSLNEPDVYIDSKKIPMKSGKIFYKKKINSIELGNVIEEGKYLVLRPANKDSFLIPFSVKYRIVK